MQVPELKSKEALDYAAYHKGGANNLYQALSHPDSLLLFRSYHASSLNQAAIDSKLKSLVANPNSVIEKDEYAEFLSAAIKRATEQHSLALSLYAFYKFFTSCVLLPLSFLWRTIDVTSIPANALLGFSVATYAFTIFHMGNHRGRSFDNKLLDSLTRPWFVFIDNLFNVPPVLWLKNHNENHHIYPNAPTDYDLLTPYPYIRLSHELPHRFHNQFQFIYALPLLGFNGFIFPTHNMKINTLKSWSYVALYYVSLLGFPVLFGGNTFKQTFWAYFITIYIAGLITAVLFQVSHNHYDNHTAVHAPFTSFKQWLSLQFEESMSWGGLVACVLFGGINYQTEHHIAPAVDAILLHYIRKDIIELAGKLNVKYTYESSFLGAVYQYLRCLYKFGKVSKRVD